jgi:hypothetical protein
VSNTLDLSAKRAARAAARKEPMLLTIGDETFELVAEMPIELIDLAADNRITESLRLLLAHPDEDWDRLRACRPSYQDVNDIVEFFGARLGESPRSDDSSTPSGPPSKPTGQRRTTAAISPRIATAPTL